jgi:hypothetical protein
MSKKVKGNRNDKYSGWLTGNRAGISSITSNNRIRLAGKHDGIRKKALSEIENNKLHVLSS